MHLQRCMIPQVLCIFQMSDPQMEQGQMDTGETGEIENMPGKQHMGTTLLSYMAV
jgi:dihydroxyacetone kinase